MNPTAIHLNVFADGVEWSAKSWDMQHISDDN